MSDDRARRSNETSTNRAHRRTQCARQIAPLDALTVNIPAHKRISIAKTLCAFSENVLAFVANAGVTIRALHDGECYKNASPLLLSMGIDVDAWPTPPAGLFVVKERRLYLRYNDPMTVAHEFGHAIDCALGNGTYYSTTNAEIRAVFATTRSFVTPYAACGLEDYFAEAIRAFVEINSPSNPWPKATKKRLAHVDPAMYSIVERLMANIA